MSIAGAICYVVVLSWLLLTVLAHLPRLSNQVRGHDSLRLIPSWNFFAPTPCSHDYHIVYRDRDANGETTAWASLDLCRSRSIVAGFWNPGKRVTKTIFDAVSSLLATLRTVTDNNHSECFSIPYLVILNAVIWCVPTRSGNIERQFAIVQSPGTTLAELDLIYVSSFHPLSTVCHVR